MSLGLKMKLFLGDRGAYRQRPIIEHRGLFKCPQCGTIKVEHKHRPQPLVLSCSNIECGFTYISTPRKRRHGK